MTKPILYTCPICKEHYPTYDKAKACRDQVRDDGGWELGDLLLMPQKDFYDHHGPFDPLWVAFTEPAWPNSDSHFEHQPKTHLWWAVVGTFVGGFSDRHEPRVIVWTGGAGPCGYNGPGWNPADGDGHYGLYRAGQLDGRTAKNTVYHMEEYQAKSPAVRYVADKIRQAVVPEQLIGHQSIKDKIIELADQLHKVPLL